MVDAQHTVYMTKEISPCITCCVHWVRTRVRVITRVYIIQRVCPPHADNFHRSFRGSNFLSRKLSRKLPWDFFLKACEEENYYLLFLIIYLTTEASVKASVEASLIPRKLPRKLPWKQIYSTKASVKAYVEASVKASVKASVEANLLPRKLPWKFM